MLTKVSCLADLLKYIIILFNIFCEKNEINFRPCSFSYRLYPLSGAGTHLQKGKLSPDCIIKCKSDILSSLYLFWRHLAIDSVPCDWEFMKKIPYQMFVTSSPIHQASNSLFICMGFICAIYIGLSCCSMTRFKQSTTGCCISLPPPTACLYKGNCIIASNLYDMICKYFSKEIKCLIHNLVMWYEIWFIALCKYFFVAVFLIWLIFNMLHISNM